MFGNKSQNRKTTEASLSPSEKRKRKKEQLEWLALAYGECHSRRQQKNEVLSVAQILQFCCQAASVWTRVLPNTHAADVNVLSFVENYSRLVSIDLLLLILTGIMLNFVILFFILQMLTKNN
jgi:hypothetical protein